MNRILIVDDEKDNLDALRRLLRKDFEVFTALSGEEGLKILQTHSDLDVILSDQRMPGMQGSEFLEKAREIETLATRILLTGFSDMDAIVGAVNRGEIWRYISKPWEPDDLLTNLKLGAERAQLSRALQLSRRELERTLAELRAKDWARDRLLQILMHEFRTAPQILEAIKELDPGDDDSKSRKRFIAQLEERFQAITKDITELLEDENKVALLPRSHLLLSDLLKELDFPLSTPLPRGPEPKLFTDPETVKVALLDLQKLLLGNSQKAALQFKYDWTQKRSLEVEVFLSLLLVAKKPILPLAFAKDDAAPELVWNALLEPFVGSEDFLKHEKGLRLETSRYIRRLRALGARLEFQVQEKGCSVELLVVFKGEAPIV